VAAPTSFAHPGEWYGRQGASPNLSSLLIQHLVWWRCFDAVLACHPLPDDLVLGSIELSVDMFHFVCGNHCVLAGWRLTASLAWHPWAGRTAAGSPPLGIGGSKGDVRRS